MESAPDAFLVTHRGIVSIVALGDVAVACADMQAMADEPIVTAASNNPILKMLTKAASTAKPDGHTEQRAGGNRVRPG
jgi:hypothetical protein